MKRLILYLFAALAAGALLFGWGYRRGAASVVVEETTRIDTVFYPRPEPLPGTYRFADISVPVLLFAPPDTVTETVVVKVGADSVQMKVAMETRPYSDSTYRAQVSGPRIGNLRPTLDWIETYDRTTINLFGIVFARKSARPLSDKNKNHEAIHTAQMRELLYVPFYIVYLLDWVFHGFKYRRITFEQEAYAHEDNPEYLEIRKHYAQWKS